MKTTPTPLTPQETEPKIQKRRRRRQNALRRFLATLAMDWARLCADFDGAHPQAVQSNSLGTFKILEAQQVPKHAGGF
jgi:hypothetical protein